MKNQKIIKCRYIILTVLALTLAAMFIAPFAIMGNVFDEIYYSGNFFLTHTALDNIEDIRFRPYAYWGYLNENDEAMLSIAIVKNNGDKTVEFGFFPFESTDETGIGISVLYNASEKTLTYERIYLRHNVEGSKYTNGWKIF